MSFLNTFLSEIYICPAGKAVLFVPDTLAVANLRLLSSYTYFLVNWVYFYLVDSHCTKIHKIDLTCGMGWQISLHISLFHLIKLS